MKNYGKELILDLHDCDITEFYREGITNYFTELCELIDMEACDLHFWDDQGVPEAEKQTDPKTTGISAIQFIITSNITIHTLDKLKAMYLNVFSCKDFDASIVVRFTVGWFKGQIVQRKEIERL